MWTFIGIYPQNFPWCLDHSSMKNRGHFSIWHHKFSQSLKGAMFVLEVALLLWNLTGISGTVLPRLKSDIKEIHYQLYGFDNWQDLMTRCLIGYWNRSLVSSTCCRIVLPNGQPGHRIYVPPSQRNFPLISEWISNHFHHKMWDEITYPLPNFNCAVEVWQWISNFISHFTGCVITYPCWD